MEGRKLIGEKRRKEGWMKVKGRREEEISTRPARYPGRAPDKPAATMVVISIAMINYTPFEVQPHSLRGSAVGSRPRQHPLALWIDKLYMLSSFVY